MSVGAAGGTPTAAASHRAANTTGILAIRASAYTIEQSNFSVGIEVANPSSVHFAYFTFCQLSSPLCYQPVAMSQNSTNWFSGTTKLMSSYNGMLVGVQAGYNITVEYTNNTNVTAPTLPNSYPSLTVAQEVCAPTPCSGAYMFEMSVGPNLYSVSGTVKDAATGAAISGATVTVTPGSNTTTTSSTGSYTLGGLVNGSYTLSISHNGYEASSQAVTINGQSAVQDIPLSNGSGSTGTPSGGGSANPLSGPVLWAVAAVAIVVVVALGAMLLRRRGGGGRGAPPAPATEVPAKDTP